MKFLRVFFVFAASAAVLGCSGTKNSQIRGGGAAAAQNAAAPGSTSKPIANPCSLATVDEVSAVMGRTSRPGELKQAFHGNRCNFYDSSSQYEVFLQTVDWNMAGPMMTPQNTVTGIGDKAFWSYGSVYVLKSGHGMMIGFQLPNVLPTLSPAARKFAETVASRM